MTEAFTYDVNLNFGQFSFTKVPDQTLSASLLQLGSVGTINRPGAVNTLRFSVQINDAVGDADLQAARIKIVVTAPW